MQPVLFQRKDPCPCWGPWGCWTDKERDSKGQISTRMRIQQAQEIRANSDHKNLPQSW